MATTETSSGVETGTSPDAEEMVELRTCDGKVVRVRKQVAMQLGPFVAHFFNQNLGENTLLLPDVSERSLIMVIKYREEHNKFKEENAPALEIQNFDDDLMKQQSNDEIRDLLFAAVYFNMGDLLTLLPKTVAERIKNKSVQFVRNFFRIVNDYTEAEEAEERSKYPWAFEGVDPDDEI